LQSDAIEAALVQLDAEEASAVRLLLLDGHTPGEAAQMLGIDTRRLRSVKQRALAKLAVLLSDWAPAAA
jgi:DNA-directed RNA polymerase specialized sigma24 family protein